MFIECEAAAQFWWRLKSRNGQIVATSETYDNKGNCKRAAVTLANKQGWRVKDFDGKWLGKKRVS